MDDDSRKYIDDHHHNFPKFNPKFEIGTQYFTNLMKNSLLLATEKLLIAKKLGFSDHFNPQNDHQIKAKKIPSKKTHKNYEIKPTYNINPSPSSSSSDHVKRYNQFPLNLISFFFMLSIKIVTFQISSFVSFVTFPISFLNFSIMLVLFPLQTLTRVKDQTKQKLLKSCNALCFGLASFILNRFKPHKRMLKIAVRSTKALLCSAYVFFLLTSLLVSGFVLSAILMRKMVEESVHAVEPLNFDYTKTSPVALVGFGPVEKMGSGLRAVPYDHKLRVTVSLTLPESEYNRKLGIFQVRVESLSTTGDTIQESSYPTMLRFKSQHLRLIHTFLNALPLIAGFESEIQTLRIAMGEFTVPTASFKVILEQRAEFKSGSGVPEIYGGSVEIASELPRLKRMVSRWRRTVFVWIGISIFVVQVMVALIFCRPVVFIGGRLGKKKSWPDRIAWYKGD